MIVYIVGRGHSGSTVLDSLISTFDGTIGVGELTAGLGKAEGQCSCGQLQRNCVFWKKVESEFVSNTGITLCDAGNKIRKASRVSQFIRRLFESTESTRVKTLVKINADVFSAIAESSGCPTIVDSSKELSRSVFLARNFSDTKIIHLVRRPDSVLASSLMRIRDGRGFSFNGRRYSSRSLAPVFVMIGSIGWVVGNILAEFVSRAVSPSAIRIRYEDLCDDYSATIRRIASYIGSNPVELIEALDSKKALPIGHTLAGNQMREHSTFLFDPDKKRRRSIPFPYLLIVNVLTLPLMMYYGYSPNWSRS